MAKQNDHGVLTSSKHSSCCVFREGDENAKEKY
jgi:hypothetical protein